MRAVGTTADPAQVLLQLEEPQHRRPVLETSGIGNGRTTTISTTTRRPPPTVEATSRFSDPHAPEVRAGVVLWSFTAAEETSWSKSCCSKTGYARVGTGTAAS
ncbi:unnamed protein product [Amoebophrya sp. A120]|nr:unnamed protein product [Amoebophrya sp. A120]|eukprot:GSA120T00025010001.1